MTVSTGRDPVPQASAAERRSESTNLDRRYGEIGISAVVAALRFASDGKNPAYAPAVQRLDARDYEAAA